MIELIGATKYYATKHGPHVVFRDVTLRLPDDINVGVIGPNGSGKSTFLRLIAGADIPNEGRILRRGRISWPMGMTAGLQRSLTGRENARFACRIYGLSAGRIRAQLERIQEISGIGRYFDMPVNTYSTGMGQRVSFAISISLGFDYYIFDEISAGGDLAFSSLAQTMMQDRLRNSRFVLASHNLSEIQRLCKAVIVIMDGRLRYYEDAEAGIAAYTLATLPEAKASPALDAAKLAKLRQQFTGLRRSEMQIAGLMGQATGEAALADLRRRAANAHDLLQEVTQQLRLLNAELPSDAEIAAEQAAAAADPALARRIAAIRHKLDELRAAEARQELNAARAETRGKRKEFLDRLAQTRLRIVEQEVDLHGVLAQARPVRPHKPSPPPRAILKR